MGTLTFLSMTVLTISGVYSGVEWKQSDDSERFEIVPRYKRSFAEEILKRLVAMATPAYSVGRRRRDYLMKGGWDSALDSFYAFKPKMVDRRFTDDGVLVIRGNADNKALTLRSHRGKGDPVLDVIDYEKKRKGKFIDRFIFTDHIDD